MRQLGLTTPARARWLGVLLTAALAVSASPAFSQNVGPNTPAAAQIEPLQRDANASAQSSETNAATPAIVPARGVTDHTAATPSPAAAKIDAVHADRGLPRNLSPVGMFLAADIVVKAVMITLLLAALLTWTTWLAKSIEIARAKRKALRVSGIIARAQTLSDLDVEKIEAAGPAGLLVRAAEEELRLADISAVHLTGAGIRERVASRLDRLQAAAAARLGKGTGILATIGAIAPFVGLFGTVWGIMNSFIGISQAHTTNLAVVAPGIAEALLATASGLFAAIPAVVIYNLFARSIAAYRHILADIAAGVERLVSRELDTELQRQAAPAAARKPRLAMEPA